MPARAARTRTTTSPPPPSLVRREIPGCEWYAPLTGSSPVPRKRTLVAEGRTDFVGVIHRVRGKEGLVERGPSIYTALRAGLAMLLSITLPQIQNSEVRSSRLGDRSSSSLYPVPKSSMACSFPTLPARREPHLAPPSPTFWDWLTSLT